MGAMARKTSVFRSPEMQARYVAAYEEALKLWPVPYEDLYVPTRFGDTHVIASGSAEAPPLVLFHPAGCGAVIWHRNVGPLSRRFWTYAVDTIGEVNRSILTRPVRSRQEFADWIVELFAGLGIGRADLVGNSFGGFLAASTALALPDRVGRLVLISPASTVAPMGAWYWHFFPAYMTGSRRLLRAAYDWIWQGFPIDDCLARMRAITMVSGSPHHTPPTVLSAEELGAIKAPTLLLIGDREVIYRPQRAIGRARSLIPNLRAEIVPNANHNAEYTAAEAVNERILEFLTGS